ncbi:MAG: hypothetical protein Q7T77_02645 [Sulfuricurvum sp.]|nr:hypothetical protein [Sulfuricurvum sp.]
MLDKKVSKFWILFAIPVVFIILTFVIAYREQMIKLFVWIVFFIIFGAIFYAFYFISKKYIQPFIKTTVVPNKFKSAVIGLLFMITTMSLIIMIRLL